ncbi:MAG: glycoside hydrolase family 3 C-terminal domain-containing protein, partial [Lachnospiraceae bacterium]|nr:glycoside hydrolase family 3 C-terminal domain-containing protein [Lachnospiraceae bacterium]
MDKFMGSGLSQEENIPVGERYVTPGMPEQIRSLAEEGIVLLKNEGNVLPIRSDQTVSVFGRIQHDWFYVGYGSGGDVHAVYERSFFQGLEQAGITYNQKLKDIYDAWCSEPEHVPDHGYWGHWPYHHAEMPLDQQVVSDAAAASDVALVIIGRAAGEDRENKLEAGCYYLTDIEKDMLSKVTTTFAHTVVIMDCGNIVDMAFLDDYKVDGVVYAWQLGMENANALANVLSGKVSPSGKLTDTIAKTYEDYPSSANFGEREYNNYVEDIYVGYRYFTTFAKEDIRYPFGFGLSYTTFALECLGLDVSEGANGTYTLRVGVTNTGDCAGKEVVQVYAEAPQGKLGKAKRVLAGFAKTKLLAPGERTEVAVIFTEAELASFDDSGVTGHKDCFLLEAGTYRFYVGTDCLCEEVAYEQTYAEDKVIEQCEEVCIPAVDKGFDVLHPLGKDKVSVAANGKTYPAAAIALGSRDLKQRILDRMPEEIAPTKDTGIKLIDVKQGKASLDAFIAQLSDVDLINLTRGEGPMNSALGVPGNAGAFGGITESLRNKGIPALITADGPAGLRIRRFTTLLPCGTAIACSWNLPLVEETFVKVGEEAKHFGVDVNLAPGMNIHRNPLCGRNFEYYAEDPLLSGRVAAACVRGLQEGGTSSCPKHFACNNQETNRNHNDSRVSMRALREIYLKN